MYPHAVYIVFEMKITFANDRGHCRFVSIIRKCNFHQAYSRVNRSSALFYCRKKITFSANGIWWAQPCQPVEATNILDDASLKITESSSLKNLIIDQSKKHAKFNLHALDGLCPIKQRNMDLLQLKGSSSWLSA